MGKIPWRSAWRPTGVFLRGESPRTEETGGLQSQGRKEPDKTEAMGHAHVQKAARTSRLYLNTF